MPIDNQSITAYTW